MSGLTGIDRSAAAIYLTLLLISLAWLAAIVAPPYLWAGGHYTSSLLIYQCFSGICHQIPERTFHFRGFPLGVCSRCTGIYLGFFLGLLFYPLLRNLRNGSFPARRWLVAAALPMVIDFTAGYTKLWANSFSSRTATGILFGSVAAFFILPGFVAAFHADDPGISPAPHVPLTEDDSL